MLDYKEYTISDNGYQGNGHNGYGKLDGDWLTYYEVAKSCCQEKIDNDG